MGKKVIITYSAIIGIIIIGLIIGGLFYFNVPSQTIYGFSTLSLSKAELTSKNPYLDGELWILTVALGGTGQSAYGTFDAEDIKTDDGKQAKRDFTLEITEQDQKCVYPVTNTGDDLPLYKLKVYEYTYIPIKDPCTIEELKTRKPDIVPNLLFKNGIYQNGLVAKCFYIYWDEKAELGRFSQADVVAEMDTVIKAGTRSGSRKINTAGSKQGEISDFAYVVWDGNFDTGIQCPQSADTSYRPAYVNGNWRVILKSRYESEYISAYNILRDRATTSNIDRDDIINALDNTNKNYDKAIISQSFGNGFESSKGDSATFNDAVLTKSLSYPIQKPVLTFYIRSALLGVYTPTPIIKLISAKSDCFKTGEDGVIQIEVKNTGDKNSTWNFYGSCEGGFTIPQSREYGVASGQTKTIILPLSGTSVERKTGKCTIYAESPGGKREIKADVCVDPQISCTPNKKYCSSSGGKDVIKECSSSGATYKIIKECASDEYCDATGNPKCVKRSDGGFFSDIWNSIKNFFKDIFSPILKAFNKAKWVFAIVIGFLGGLVSLLYTIRFTGEEVIKSKKARYLTYLAVFLILGIAIGLLSYWYFWWIVGILTLLLIIKIFI